MSQLVIDGKGHVEGRLAAAVAKQLLKGRRITVLRCEELILNGEHTLSLHRWERFAHKTTNSNPRLGPFHLRAPSAMFTRAVRGMLPYKTPRGAEALSHLKCYEGVPEYLNKVKAVVVPTALRCVSIRKDRATTKLGELATSVGWSYGSVVEKLESKRKAEAVAHYKKVKGQKKRAIEAANKKLSAEELKFLTTFKE